MTTQVIYQKNFIADLNGKPLENGSLYIGVANQDPETNPLTVYWDPALTQVRLCRRPVRHGIEGRVRVAPPPDSRTTASNE